MRDQDDGSKIMKAVLIGDGAVGKTSIRRNYLGEDFIEGHLATIGVDLATKRVLFEQDIVKFIIWDLAGQPTFEKVRGRAPTPLAFTGGSPFGLCSPSSVAMSDRCPQASSAPVTPIMIGRYSFECLNRRSRLD